MRKILGLLLVTGVFSALIFILCKKQKLPIKCVLRKDFCKNFFSKKKKEEI